MAKITIQMELSSGEMLSLLNGWDAVTIMSEFNAEVAEKTAAACLKEQTMAALKTAIEAQYEDAQSRVAFNPGIHKYDLSPALKDLIRAEVTMVAEQSAKTIIDERLPEEKLALEAKVNQALAEVTKFIEERMEGITAGKVNAMVKQRLEAAFKAIAEDTTVDLSPRKSRVVGNGSRRISVDDDASEGVS